MKSYKATATIAESKKCSALVKLARAMMPQEKREAQAITMARIPGCAATVLDADIAFALEGCADPVVFLNRVLNLANPSNRHVVKNQLADALDAQYVAETPVLVRAVEAAMSFTAKMAAAKAAKKAARLAAAAV